MKTYFVILFFCFVLAQICFAQTYKYDAVNRLVQVSSNCSGTLYTYDVNGNRTSINQISIATTSSITDEKCGNDGKIVITPQDASAKYTYSWSNGKITAGITNLKGGTYSVVIMDPNSGFTCDQTFTIKGVFKDSITVVPQQIVCNGANNGKARIKIVTPDTVGSYQYHWSTSSDTSYTSLDSLVNLKPGTYSVDVRNTARNCVKTQNFTITEPPVIITGISQIDASCPGVSDGSASVQVNGDPANYTFAWTGPISGTLRTTQITGLPVGNYTLVVTQKGTLCTLTRTVKIGAVFTAATISAAGPTSFVMGQNVLLSANTGPSYAYQWSKNGINILGAINPSYTASTSGLYTVKITVNNCTLTAVPFDVNVLPINNFTVSATNETCRISNNGTIDVTTLASLNYIAKVSVKNGDTVSYPFTNSLHIDNLSAGNYTVCIAVKGQGTFNQCYDLAIKEPQDLAVYNVVVNNFAKTITLSLDGGSTYSLQLNGNSYTTTETQITLPIKIGSNNLRITADKLCQGVFEREFTLSDGIVVFPNPFERTISIGVGTETTKRIGVKIFDVVGNIVYSNTLNNEEGFLTVNLPDFLKGVYSLTLSISNQVFKIVRK